MTRNNRRIAAEYLAASKHLERMEAAKRMATADLRAGRITNADWHAAWNRHDEASQRYDRAADARADSGPPPPQTSLDYWSLQQ